MRASSKAALLLVGAVCLLYLNALPGSFLFDDDSVIVDYAPVHSFSGWFGALKTGIRPVLKLTYLLNWVSNGGPAGYHAVNIGIHAINSLLVYLLALKLCRLWHPESGSRAPGTPALLTALLFAVHPVQTEAVSYICGRSSSLMALFFLGSVLSYLYGVERGSRSLLYLASPVLYLLAIGTKETALTLPLMLALLEWVRRRPVPGSGWSAALRNQAVHWLLFLAALVLVLAHPRYGRLIWFSLEIRSLHDNLLSQINGITYLLSRLVMVGRLNIDPDLPTLRSWTAALAGQFAVLAAMLSAALLSARRRSWISLGIIWFFLVLLPSNSIIPRLDIANERHLYLANFGIFLLVGMELSRAGLLEKRWGRTAVAMVLCLLSGFTVLRNGAYQSEMTLWADTAQKSPNKSRVINNLGLAYELDGQKERAASLYQRAVVLDPRNLIARRNLVEIGAQ